MNYPYGNFGAFNAPQTFLPQGGGNYTPTPQQMPVSVPQAAGNSVRLVTSREEVTAAQIPFDGSTAYFSDTSNGKIYTKTFDFNTGTAPVVTYVREQEVKVQYATLDDINALRAEIETMKQTTKKGAKKNDADE